MNKNDLHNLTNFFFEVGMLAKTPRSGFFFMGTGNQSVAEHINRVVFIGYALAAMNPKLDSAKILKMCLMHDVGEARVSDLNYVHQKYTERREDIAIKDLADTLPFGDEMLSLAEEYKKRETPEAKIVKDADNLEWLLSIKEQIDTGNKWAERWAENAQKRLITDEAKQLAEHILNTHFADWWTTEGDDDWWVHRKRKK